MDFPTQDALVQALNEEEGWGSGMIRIYRSLANDFMYQDPYNLVIFPDNHDMSRFYTQVNEDFKLFKLGITFIATTRGIPQILYGTEILKSNPGTNDHGVIRSDFPGGWKGDDKNGFNGKGLTNKEKEAQNFFRKLLNWRKNEEVIHTGNLKHYLPEEGLYVYFRYNEDKTIMVILNKNDKKTQKLDTEKYRECLKGRDKGINVLSGEKINNLEQVKIEPKEALIIEIIK
jgi:glycosidase